MNLQPKPLEPQDLETFASNMQAAFQLAVNSASEDMPLPVLPREDIDASLAAPNAEALVAWMGNTPVGGAVLFLNHKTQEHECALLYVAAHMHGKGIGSRLWELIEKRYPDAKAWTLCTPCFETRNIHFYLRKCGFHIVDIFEDETPEAPGKEESALMYSFLKRLDGRWE